MLTSMLTRVGPFSSKETPNVWAIQFKDAAGTVVSAMQFAAQDPEQARALAVDYLAFLQRQQWQVIPGAKLERPVEIISPFPPTVTRLLQQLVVALQTADAPSAEVDAPTPGAA